MKKASEFFDKFNNSAVKELRNREVISKALKKIIKQEIDIKDISIKNGIIAIKSSQSLKSEIFLKKRLILDHILKNIQNIKISDIK